MFVSYVAACCSWPGAIYDQQLVADILYAQSPNKIDQNAQYCVRLKEQARMRTPSVCAFEPSLQPTQKPSAPKRRTSRREHKRRPSQSFVEPRSSGSKHLPQSMVAWAQKSMREPAR